MESSLAVMQPYLFPYIGYFQLINSVQTFVFYDDVDFIKNGWINRNRILINNKPKYLTIPVKKKSQSKSIQHIEHGLNSKKRGKLERKVKFSYSNAPYFDDVFPIIKEIIYTEKDYISNLACASIRSTCKYLNIETEFKKSSEAYNNNTLDRADRLIDITTKENAKNYINMVGGDELYDKSYFAENGINLHFLEPGSINYKQFGDVFVERLSIVDIMMFNSPEKIRNDFLSAYELI